MPVRESHPTSTPAPPDAAGAPAASGRGTHDALDLGVLVAAAAGGDQRAWATLVRAYSARIYALAKSRCRNDTTAQEITQSVFVTLATKLRAGTYAEQGRFEPWMFRIAMNRIRDEMRRVKRQATPTDPATLADARIAPDDPPRADAGELAALRSAMQSLSGPDREVVELRHHAGMSFQQIADTLGQPMGTVLARHHRALKKLRTILDSNASMKEAG
jgi:RNA polymerase sigma-70 factor (ECF subfamily)